MSVKIELIRHRLRVRDEFCRVEPYMNAVGIYKPAVAIGKMLWRNGLSCAPRDGNPPDANFVIVFYDEREVNKLRIRRKPRSRDTTLTKNPSRLRGPISRNTIQSS